MSTLDTEKENLTSITQTDEEEVDTSLIVQLPPKIQRFIHLHATGQYTLNKLAQLLEVHPNTVGKWMKRKDVQSAMAELQETTHIMVASTLKNMTLAASARLSELMNSSIDGVALQAVKDVLDRAGHKPKQEIKVDKTVVTIEEKLKNLIDDVIDVDYEEVK